MLRHVLRSVWSCFNVIPATTVAALPPPCISLINANDWTEVTAQQISALTTSEVAAITGPQIASLDVAACAGFLSAQLPFLSTPACQKIASGCFGNIPAAQYGGLTQGCVSAAQVNAFSMIDQNQLAAITPTAITAISAVQLSNLQPTACLGFTQQQVLTFTTQCSGIQPTCLDNFDVQAVGGVGQQCIQSITPASFSVLSDLALGALPTASVGYLNATQVAGLDPGACVGWTAQQVAQFNVNPPQPYGNLCIGFSPACIAAFSTSAFSGFTKKCVQAGSSQIFSQIAPQQLGALPVDVVATLYPAQIAAMAQASPSPFSGLIFNQTRVLGENCAGVAPVSAGSLTQSAIAGIQPTCVKALQPAVFGSFSAPQLSNFSLPSIAVLSSAQFARVLNDSCAGFTPGQMGQITAACAETSPYCFEKITPASFGGLQGGCVSAATNDAFSRINSDQLKTIPASAVGTLSAAQIAVVKDDTCGGFTGDQAGSLSTACPGITGGCLTHIPDDSVPSLQGICVGGLQDAVFGSWKTSQVSRISPAAVAFITKAQLTAMNPDSCAGYDGNQTATLGTSGTSSSDVCSGFQNACVGKLSARAVSGISAACTGWITPGVFVVFSAPQVASLSIPAVQAILPGQANFLADTGCAGFTATQGTAFLPNLCKGLISHSAVDCLATGVWGAINGECLGCVESPAALAVISPSSLGAISLTTLPSLDFDPSWQAMGANGQCSGFTQQQLNALSQPVQSACAGFTSPLLQCSLRGRYLRIGLRVRLEHCVECDRSTPAPASPEAQSWSDQRAHPARASLRSSSRSRLPLIDGWSVAQGNAR